MTTLANLVAAGILKRIEPHLEADEQPFRRLYCAPSFVSWLDHVLPTIPKDWSDVDCHVQVDTALIEFVDGTSPLHGRDLVPSIKPIDHPFRGVWEMKTADIRIFGWFAEFDAFVIVCADAKAKTKQVGAVRAMQDAVVAFRSSLPGGLPPHLDSGELRHVCSL